MDGTKSRHRTDDRSLEEVMIMQWMFSQDLDFVNVCIPF